MDDPPALELPWGHLIGSHCFGCSPRNPAGLALQAVDTEDGLSCQFTMSKLHESYPGIVHGGIATTILDELMGNLLALREQRFCVTVGLRVRFLAPLHTGRPYQARVRVVERPSEAKGQYRVEGEILDDQEESRVVASGSYQWMTAEQARQFLSLTDAEALAFRHWLRVPEPPVMSQVTDAQGASHEQTDGVA